MGLIRTLLAISVVFAHTIGFVIVGGDIAVRLFYMISGYLISYIIVEAHAYPSIKKFYINRFLRLFPAYWLIAGFVLVSYCLAYIFGATDNYFFSVYGNVDIFGFAALTLANILILGQDWLMFTAVKGGVFQFAQNFRDTEVNVWLGLLVPQAWTLGVELSFYLVAPFILKNKIVLFSSFVFSIGVKIYLLYIGLGSVDPWNHRFFPAELSIFIIGAFSHQIVMPFFKNKMGASMERYSGLVVAVVFFICSVFFLLPKQSRDDAAYGLMALFFFALPFLFVFQSKNKLDSKIGNLSYPIYVCHMLVIYICDIILGNFLHGSMYRYALGVMSVLGSVAVAYFLEVYFVSRLESVRARFKIGK